MSPLSMSDYTETEIKKHFFRTGNAAAITANFVHLLKTLPSDDAGTGAVGIAMTGYSAKDVPPLDANWSVVVDNVAEIDFLTWTAGGPERIIGWAVGSSATLGTMDWYFYGAMAKDWVKGSIDQGTDTIFIYGHSFSDDDRVFLRDIAGTTGITEAIEYWVVNSTADSIEVSLTQGGAAVVFATGDGSCEVGASQARVVQNGDPVKIPAGDLDVFFD